MSVQVFGGNSVQSAYISYLSLDITANDLTLVWPDAYVNVPYTNPGPPVVHYNSVAAYMNVLTSGAPHTITLPDATLTSVGQSFIITNIGTNPFNLLTSDGSLLATIDIGLSLYFLLTSNTLPGPIPDPAGTWSMVTFGAGTSAIIAAALAGYGLIATGDNKLNTSVPVGKYVAIPIIDETFRAKLIVWTGGAVTLTLPLIGSVPAGFYVSFTNQSVSQIVIQPGEGGTLISGQPNQPVLNSQSLTIISDGANWWTLGFGQKAGGISTNNLNVTTGAGYPGVPSYTLSPAQASNLIQEYSGVLQVNTTVYFPIETGNWVVSNSTSANYTLAVQLAGPTGAPFIIPQGTTQEFVSDGTTMFPTQTSLLAANGSVTAPTIAFGNTPVNATGFYYDPADFGTLFIVNDGNALVQLTYDIGHTYFNIVGPGGSFAFNVTVNSATGMSLAYHGITFLSVDAIGAVTLPAAPLPIGSGGTNAIAQPAAAINVLPPAVAGNMLFFNGTNWIVVPPGTAGGQHLTWVSPTVPPTWS